MCGIVGYVGPREASDVLIAALKRLEYRGYDSAGVAALDGHGIEVRRCVGKLGNLERLLTQSPLAGSIGIGHTRWATHGRPSEENAHPHRAGRVVLIHNGIIENYLELRAELVANGRKLLSETDSEVIAHLVDEELRPGVRLLEATRRAVCRLHGSFSIVVMSESERDRLVAAKTATPIVIGLGENENLIASDIPAILEYTRDMLFLEDGEIAEVTRDGVALFDFEGRPKTRAPRRVTWDAVTAQKGGYKHFLLKEIYEQPQALIDTLRGRIRLESGDVQLAELDPIAARLERVERLTLTACGTAWHAALVGKFFFNELTQAAGRGRLRERAALPGACARRARSVDRGVAVRRDRRYARRARRSQTRRRDHACHLQRGGLLDRPPCRRRAVHTRGARDQRRLDEGLHHAARGVSAARHRLRATSRTRRPRAGKSVPRGAAERTAVGRASAADRAGGRTAGAQILASPRLPLPRPRHQLPGRARGRAQAEGALVHPRGRLSRRGR